MTGEKGLEEVKKEAFLKDPYGILMKILFKDGGFKEETLQLDMALNRIAFPFVGKTWVSLMELEEIASEEVIPYKLTGSTKQNVQKKDIKATGRQNPQDRPAQHLFFLGGSFPVIMMECWSDGAGLI